MNIKDFLKLPIEQLKTLQTLELNGEESSQEYDAFFQIEVLEPIIFKNVENHTFNMDGITSVVNQYSDAINSAVMMSELDDESFQTLVFKISQCSALQELILSNNVLYCLNEVRSQALFNAIPECHKLQTLKLNNNKLGYSGVAFLQSLFDAILQCHEIQTLDLTRNYFCYSEEATFQVLCNFLEKSCNLQTVVLARNKLDELDEKKIKLFNGAVQRREEQISNKHKETAKAFLFSWNKSQKENTTSIKLGSLPNSLIMKILADAGCIHNVESGNPKIAKSLALIL
jgi:hypothetical protein